MRSSMGRVAWVWFSTLAVAFALLSSSWGSGKREVYVLKAWVLRDAATLQWVPTGPLVASREGASHYQSTLVLRSTGRGAVLTGTAGANLTLRPESYDPASNRWAPFHGALPTAPAAPSMPAAPTAHHVVVSCGAGCALALPSDAEAIAGTPVGLSSPSAPVFIHEGAWRPLGTLPVSFTLPLVAVRTPRRLVVIGFNTPFNDLSGEHSAALLGWSRAPDAAEWGNVSFDQTAWGYEPHLAATPSGALFSFDGAAHGSGPVVAWVLPEGASEPQVIAPTVPGPSNETFAQAATLLADGRLLAVGSTREERTDPLGLVGIARSLLVALAIVALNVALVRKGKLSGSSIAVGIALAVATFVAGIFILGALMAGGIH